MIRRPFVSLILLLALAPLARAETLDVVRKVPHGGWEEGFKFHDGMLWASYPGGLQEMDPDTGAVVATFAPATSYEESIAWLNGKLYSLSWVTNGIYEATLSGATLTWTEVGAVVPPTGDGMANDDRYLILDGHGWPDIYFVDPTAFTVAKTLTLPFLDAEDFGWDGSYIWASSGTAFPGTMARINPDTGEVVDFYSLPEPSECPWLDGVDFKDGEVWLTGKDCPFFYVAPLPPP